MEELLRSVISALDTIEVRGRYNRNTLSDCVNALESIADALSALHIQRPNEDKKEGNDG